MSTDAFDWGPNTPPEMPPPAPIGPIGERLLRYVDEGLAPTYGDPEGLRDTARVLALAAVVDSPWNPTVARAAAQMFHAGRGSGEGATPTSIRRRVELLLAPMPRHPWEPEGARREVLALALDMVAVMVMAGQRVNGDTDDPPIAGMNNMAGALSLLVEVMSRNLAADDYRAHLAGYPKEAIRNAAFAHSEFIEGQIAAWCPDAPPRPRRSRRVDPLDEHRARNLAALLDEPDEQRARNLAALDALAALLDEPDEGGASGGAA